jgi:hypothetical protein
MVVLDSSSSMATRVSRRGGPVSRRKEDVKKVPKLAMGVSGPIFLSSGASFGTSSDVAEIDSLSFAPLKKSAEEVQPERAGQPYGRAPMAVL